jgi:predicted deacylase
MSNTVRTLLIKGLPEGGLEIPYFEIRGVNDGPHLTLLAGIHGTEYTSIAAVREFARGLDPKQVSGLITAIPIVNLPAFWARSPFVVPADGKNLNRNFPGDPNGTYAEVLADQVTQNFFLGSDYLIDLHAGDLPEALEPFAIYEESPVEEKSRALAIAYGLGHIVRQSAAARIVSGSTCAAAADLGIPAIVAESGQNGLMDRSAVNVHIAGLTNAARSIGVLAGEVSPPPKIHEHEGWHWLSAPANGWWEPEVSVGAQVAADQLLGTVSEICGGVIAEIRAPEAGVLLFLTTSPAVVSGGVLLGLARDEARNRSE